MTAARYMLYAFTVACAVATVMLLLSMVQSDEPDNRMTGRPDSSAGSTENGSVRPISDLTPSIAVLGVRTDQAAGDSGDGGRGRQLDRQLQNQLIGQWEPADPGPGWDIHILQLAPAGDFSFTCWTMSSDRPRFRCVGRWSVTGNGCLFSADHDRSSEEWKILAALIRAGQSPTSGGQAVNPDCWVWTIDKIDEENIQLANGQQWIRSPFRPPDQVLVDAAESAERLFKRVYSHVAFRIGTSAMSREDLRLKVRTLCNLAESARMGVDEVIELFDHSLNDAQAQGLERQFGLDAAIQGASLRAAMIQQP